MVGDVPTGGITATAPTNSETVAASCRRLGCDRAATLFWTEQVTGKTIAYCAEDGVEAFNLITRWLGEPQQRIRLEEFTVAVEKVTGKGLYAQPPRVRDSYDGDDRATKR